MPTHAREPWITTAEVSAYLGKPESWIHNNAERVGLPRRRLGNQYRYRLSEIDAWLDTSEAQ
jgi:excisionase family DNA binding protein